MFAERSLPLRLVHPGCENVDCTEVCRHAGNAQSHESVQAQASLTAAGQRHTLTHSHRTKHQTPAAYQLCLAATLPSKSLAGRSPRQWPDLWVWTLSAHACPKLHRARAAQISPGSPLLGDGMLTQCCHMWGTASAPGLAGAWRGYLEACLHLVCSCHYVTYIASSVPTCRVRLARQACLASIVFGTIIVCTLSTMVHYK